MTDAEVDAAVKICQEIKAAFGCGISSIPVDNAGSCVAIRTAERLATEGAPEDRDKPIRSRDCAHCMDLLPKNLADTFTMKSVMSEAKEIYNFTSIHRINSIRIEMIEAGTIIERTTVKNVVDTRMNLIEIHLSSARKQSSFLAALPQNEKWVRYYNECNRDTKQKLDQILQNCSHGRWQRMDTAIGLVTIFRTAHLLCSRRDMPLSAYVLMVQAVKNMVHKSLTEEDGKYDRIMGEGAAQEVLHCIGMRFNMDESPIPGQKVGLLNKHHLW